MSRHRIPPGGGGKIPDTTLQQQEATPLKGKPTHATHAKKAHKPKGVSGVHAADHIDETHETHAPTGGLYNQVESGMFGLGAKYYGQVTTFFNGHEVDPNVAGMLSPSLGKLLGLPSKEALAFTTDLATVLGG
jgi:hypothetical protein